jgi:hypothetical protein
MRYATGLAVLAREFQAERQVAPFRRHDDAIDAERRSFGPAAGEQCRGEREEAGRDPRGM